MERRKEFTSLEEAFEALPEGVREHSYRVEKYAELIFLELCAAEEYLLNIHSRVRLRSDNRSNIGLAARYHDIGKVLVPEIYAWNDPDFNQEELALYRRHCLAGDELAHNVTQEQKNLAPMTIDIICEGIAYHHERWDGEGYPHGFAGEHIPIVGRIVSVADELDRRLMNMRSETPVQTAIEAMMYHSATRYDPVIMGLLYDAKHKVEKIFAQYRGESKAIPQAPRVIRRKSRRPMWLRYRPIVYLNSKGVAAVEAEMQFKRGKDEVGILEAEPLLRKNKTLYDAGLCFLLEACDMAKRMRNCEVGGDFIALNCVSGFLKKRGGANAISKIITESDSYPEAICFIIKGSEMATPSVALSENCTKLRALGCSLMCSGISLEALDVEVLKALTVDYYRISAEDIENIDSHIEKLASLVEAGITLIGDGVDKHRLSAALIAKGIYLASGDAVGEYSTEDDFILGELALVGDK